MCEAYFAAGAPLLFYHASSFRALFSLRGILMANMVERAIYQEAQKLVTRHQTYAHKLSEHLKRREIRSARPITKIVKLPAYWDCDPGFNPYHVRKHYKSIAYAINKALQSKNYSPNPAVLREIPKPGGGFRQLSVFQVADQAVSRMVFQSLMDKNASRLSPKCYAYRTDVTIHDAVLNIASSFHGKQRVFIAEYDFKDFLPSISHEAVQSILSDRHFYVTNREMDIVMQFLMAPRIDSAVYGTSPKSPTQKGIPLGTSISLFVANLVTYRLAQALEGLGVDFAFYSDDSLIWSNSYENIANAVEVITQTANEMGVSVNFLKSDGISLLASPEAPKELAGKDSVSFVGYKIDGQTIGMKPALISRAKRQIIQLVFSNLLQEPLAGVVNPARLTGSIDKDYLVMVNQIRRYLFGNLNEFMVTRYLSRAAPRIHYRGFMSFFPIVDDEKLLQQLDGWLAS